MAFLLDMRTGNDIPRRWIALSRVETNARIKKLAGKRNVTDVNVLLVTASFGTAVVITLLSGLLACSGWILYVAKPGRRNYNKFNSASDAMSCASFAMFGNEDFSHSGRNSGILLKATDGFVRPERERANEQ